MREKHPALVITFATTAAAMKAESFCKERQLPGRLIPVPREITASCGLAWKSVPEEQGRFQHEFLTGGLQWAAMQIIEI